MTTHEQREMRLREIAAQHADFAGQHAHSYATGWPSRIRGIYRLRLADVPTPQRRALERRGYRDGMHGVIVSGEFLREED